MYIAFIILISTFFGLQNSRLNTCLHETKSAQQIVAIVYKIFFLVICVTLITGFLVYGYKILSAFNNSTGPYRQSSQRTIGLGTVSIICALSLLAQAINMIIGSFDNDRPLTANLIFILVVEIIPSVIFNILWGNGSIFAAAKGWLTQTPTKSSVSNSGSGSGMITPRSEGNQIETPKLMTALESLNGNRNENSSKSESSDDSESETLSLYSLNGTHEDSEKDDSTISLSFVTT